MQITINGKPQTVQNGITLQALLSSLGIDSQTVVVERKQTIYSSEEFAGVVIHPDDILEIVRFMGGG